MGYLPGDNCTDEFDTNKELEQGIESVLNRVDFGANSWLKITEQTLAQYYQFDAS